MVSVSLIPLAFALSVSAALPKQQTDGSDPTGTVDPLTIKDCTFWVIVESGIQSAKNMTLTGF